MSSQTRYVSEWPTTEWDLDWSSCWHIAVTLKMEFSRAARGGSASYREASWSKYILIQTLVAPASFVNSRKEFSEQKCIKNGPLSGPSIPLRGRLRWMLELQMHLYCKTYTFCNTLKPPHRTSNWTSTDLECIYIVKHVPFATLWGCLIEPQTEPQRNSNAFIL